MIRNPDALICFSQLKDKNEYIYQHCLRVCILALAFGRHLGLTANNLEELGLSALLHDVGKMRIPQSIVDKRHDLSHEEVAVMRTHVHYAIEILQQSKLSDAVMQGILQHHERYDGSGYPQGLRGEMIGQFGLIVGLVDFYDAVTSERPYREAISPSVALRHIYQARGKAFHPTLVESLIQCIGVYPIGSVVELNTGDVGVVLTLNRKQRLKPKIALVLQADNRPYSHTRIIDLVSDKTRKGSIYEIANATEAKRYGIDPRVYLPISKAS